MGTVLGLKILVRIPIGVINDDGVGGLQVKTQPTRTSGEQETEVFRVHSIKLLEEVGPVVRLGGTVKSEIPESSQAKEIFHDVHDLSHLEKHQDSMTASFELWQDSIEKFEFACGTPYHVVGTLARIHLVLHRLEDEGVVTEFSQLHQHVAETPHASLAAFVVSYSDLVVSHQLQVQLGLQRREFAFDHTLLLVW